MSSAGTTSRVSTSTSARRVSIAAGISVYICCVCIIIAMSFTSACGFMLSRHSSRGALCLGSGRVGRGAVGYRATSLCASSRRAPHTKENNKEHRKTSVSDPWRAVLNSDNFKKHIVKKMNYVTAAAASNFPDSTAPENMDAGKLKLSLECDKFQVCGGCTVSQDFLNTQSARKATQLFGELGVSNFQIKMGKPHNWRTHAKLAVQPVNEKLHDCDVKIGLYKPGTHTVERIPDCPVHHPVINQGIRLIEEAANVEGITGYVSGSGKYPSRGELRYIQLSVDRRTQKLQTTLVWNGENFKQHAQSIGRLIKHMYKLNGTLWHSVSINFNDKSSNAIFNFDIGTWKLLRGEPYLVEKIGAVDVFLVPQAFWQANLEAFEQIIIPEVMRRVPEHSSVAELYAGTGVIGESTLYIQPCFLTEVM
jgi:hypothetical protein